MKYIFDKFSQKTSKLITNEYSTSFSFSSALLGKNIRPAIYSIYGFVRLADEVVDSFHNFEKENLLSKLEADYHDAIEQLIDQSLTHFSLCIINVTACGWLILFKKYKMDLQPQGMTILNIKNIFMVLQKLLISYV